MGLDSPDCNNLQIAICDLKMSAEHQLIRKLFTIAAYCQKCNEVSVKLTRPSFAKRRRLLNEMCKVKFDSCNNLLSFVHTVLVKKLCSASL